MANQPGEGRERRMGIPSWNKYSPAKNTESNSLGPAEELLCFCNLTDLLGTPSMEGFLLPQRSYTVTILQLRQETIGRLHPKNTQHRHVKFTTWDTWGQSEFEGEHPPGEPHFWVWPSQAVVLPGETGQVWRTCALSRPGRGTSGIWWEEVGVPLNSLWHTGCPPSKQNALALKVTALRWRWSNPKQAFSPFWLEVYLALLGVLGLLVNCGWRSAQEGQVLATQPPSYKQRVPDLGREAAVSKRPPGCWEGFSTPSTLGRQVCTKALLYTSHCSASGYVHFLFFPPFAQKKGAVCKICIRIQSFSSHYCNSLRFCFSCLNASVKWEMGRVNVR